MSDNSLTNHRQPPVTKVANWTVEIEDVDD